MKTHPFARAALLSGLLLTSTVAWTAPSSPSGPYAWIAKAGLAEAERIPVLGVPPVDRQALLAEDEANYAPNRGEAGNKRMRVAIGNDVAVNSRHDGLWETLGDGTRIWRMRVSAPNATELHLGLSGLDIPEDAEIYVYSLDEQYAAGPYGARDINQYGDIWVAAVPGDEAVVTLRLPDPRDEHQIGIRYVGAGYRDMFGREGGFVPLGTGPGASGACNINVVCPLGDPYRDEIRSVAHYSFVDGGTWICTGTLLNNHAQDGKPYFITANHCVSSNAMAATMTFYWNYESTQCNALTGYTLSQNQSGAQLRMTRSDTDTTLVELNAVPNPAYNVYYSGWDATGVTPGGVIGIHHPSGDVKKITEDNNGVSTMNNCIGGGVNSHWRTGAPYSQGTTEGGSSGSGIWVISGDSSGNEKLLIGVLSGGTAACTGSVPNSGYDCYGKFSASWDGASASARLRDWLDPDDTGVLVRPGTNGGTPPETDLAISLDAGPNPVDIGGQVTIDVDVSNGGPDAASGVSVVVALPTGILYSSAGPAAWSCSHLGGTVTCSLGGSIAAVGSAPTLSIVANVNASETGTVTVTAGVSALGNDPDSGNNEASLDLEITGEPPLPDAIFCSGFEDGDDGSCGPPVDPDIVDSGPVNIVVPASVGINGFSINWVTGATCNCDADPGYDFNPYARAGDQLAFWFYPGSADPARAGMAVGGRFAVLSSGATVGPSSTFASVDGNSMDTYMVDWRAGVHGYLGFRFRNPDTNEINYGYAELDTGPGGGFPMTIVRYWYNKAGNAITIP